MDLLHEFIDGCLPLDPIGKSEKDQLTRMFSEIFDRMPWETEDKRETQEKLWKRIMGKAMLTNREAYGLMGFLRKVINIQEGKVTSKDIKKKPVRTKKKKTAKNTPVKRVIKSVSVKDIKVKKTANKKSVKKKTRDTLSKQDLRSKSCSKR